MKTPCRRDSSGALRFWSSNQGWSSRRRAVFEHEDALQEGFQRGVAILVIEPGLVIEWAAKGAQTMLFVGTSFAVGVTDMILETGLRRGAELFSIDPSGRSPHRRVNVISEAAEEYLPGSVRGLRGAQP